MTASPEITWRFDFTSSRGNGYFEVDPTNFLIPTSAAHPSTFEVIAADIDINAGGVLGHVHYTLGNLAVHSATPAETTVKFTFPDFIVPGIARYQSISLQLNFAPLWETWTTPDQHTVQLFQSTSPFAQSTSWNDTGSIERTVVIHTGNVVIGTQGADLIDATHTAAGQPLPTDLADQISGRGGNDTLSGLGGNDVINGGAGEDTMYGGGGNDRYRVDNAGDHVVELANQGTDTVLTSTSYTLEAGSEVEVLRAAVGSAGLALTGNEVNNRIIGGGGDDTIQGGAGRDVLTGGAGRDTFVFTALTDSVVGTARDKIVDFAEGTDKIDLSAIDAILGTPADDGFHFVGDGPLKHAGDLRAYVVGANTFIAGDVDGDRHPDFQILLGGVHTIAAGDFIL